MVTVSDMAAGQGAESKVESRPVNVQRWPYGADHSGSGLGWIPHKWVYDHWQHRSSLIAIVTCSRRPESIDISGLEGLSCVYGRLSAF